MKQQKKTNKIEWKEVELGEVANFLRGPFGSSVQKSVCVLKGINTYKLYEQGNIINNDFERGKYYINRDKFNELGKFELIPGDIAITCAGTLGKIALAPQNIEKGIINSVLMRIRVDKSKLLPNFFINFFKSPFIQDKIQSQSQGVALKNLFATNQLRRFKIPLPFLNGEPDLKEQERIVNILEKAETLKQKQKRSLELYDEYLKSVFWEMFLKEKEKFEERPLSQIVEVNPKKSEIKDLSQDIQVSFLGMADIGEKGELFNIQIKRLKDVITGFTYFKKNDVLFAKITPCMENGKGAIAKIPTEIGFGSTEFHVLRPNKDVLSEYIYFILSLKQTRKNAEINMTGSAGQKRVPTSFFNILKIPLPPLPLQQKFASIVEKVEKLKEKQKKTLADSEELFNVLMQKAFKGELN